MTDEMKRALMSDILDRVGSQGIGQLILEQNNTIQVGQPQPVQMPPYLTREQGMSLYRFLVDGEYIAADTPSDDFLYLMGVSANAPIRLKPINWLNTVQQLRTMLTCAFSKPMERKAIKLAELERRAPECFLIKSKKMNNLAKPTQENSIEMDKLTEFFDQNEGFCK